jgi:hypothetical protein
MASACDGWITHKVGSSLVDMNKVYGFEVRRRAGVPFESRHGLSVAYLWAHRVNAKPSTAR